MMRHIFDKSKICRYIWQDFFFFSNNQRFPCRSFIFVFKQSIELIIKYYLMTYINWWWMTRNILPGSLRLHLSCILQDRDVPASSPTACLSVAEFPMTQIRDCGTFPSASSMFWCMFPDPAAMLLSLAVFIDYKD